MKNFKLRTKFLIALIPMLALIVALCFAMIYMTSYIQTSLEQALYDELYVVDDYLLNADRDYQQAFVADLNMYKGGLMPDETAKYTEDYFTNYQEAIDNVKAAAEVVAANPKLYESYTLNSLLAANGKEASENRFADRSFKELEEAYYVGMDKWFNLYDPTTKTGMFFTQELTFDETREYLTTMEEFVAEYGTYRISEVRGVVQTLLSTIIGAAVIVTILVCLIVIFIISSILRNVKKIEGNLDNLAKNNLAFKPATVKGKDEIAHMSRSVLFVKDSLSRAIGAVNSNADEIASNIVQVTAGIASSAEGVFNINTAVDEVAQTSQQVAMSAEELANKSVDMGSAIESIATSIDSLKEASTQIDMINKEATKSMEDVMKSSEVSVEAVKDITEKINETNNAVVRIDECVQMITDISSQTNLLSLNASIEAARAGEAGRGFAVVAEEIRKLADTSAMSAGEISTIVKNVIEISNGTVASAKRVSEVIESEQASVKDTQAKFVTLSSAVEDSLESIAAIQQMSMGLEDIKDELSDATSTLSAISEELGASAQEVSATCSQVSMECESAKEHSDVMNNRKNELQTAVNVFQLG